MLEYMETCPHIFAPMQGTRTVHQHKQMKLEGGGLHPSTMTCEQQR